MHARLVKFVFIGWNENTFKGLERVDRPDSADDISFPRAGYIQHLYRKNRLLIGIYTTQSIYIQPNSFIFLTMQIS